MRHIKIEIVKKNSYLLKQFCLRQSNSLMRSDKENMKIYNKYNKNMNR